MLLEEYFGSVASAVGSHLSRWQNVSLSDIMRHVKKAKPGISALVNHHMVTFKQGSKRVDTAEYSVDLERILLLARYPRYMYLAKSMLGGEAELLVEELLKMGQDTPENLILRSTKRLAQDAEDVTSSELIGLHQVFCQMVSDRYLEKCPDPNTDADGASQGNDDADARLQRFTVPHNIDFKNIQDLAKRDKEIALDESSSLFRVNFDRFHRLFRDQIIVSSVSRRIDVSAGHLMRIFLSKVDADRATADGISNHIYLLNIVDEINSANCTDVKLRQFREHYIKILEEVRTY